MIQWPTENSLDVFVKISMSKKFTFFFGAGNEKFTSFTRIYLFIHQPHPEHLNDRYSWSLDFIFVELFQGVCACGGHTIPLADWVVI